MLVLALTAPWHVQKMYNQNQDHNKAPPMSPRISFSNDFVETSRSDYHSQYAAPYRDAPVSSDFEFTVSNYSMMPADELLFKRRPLPLTDGCGTSHKTTTTLRDELQNNEEVGNNESFSLRPPKNPTRWKGFLGLRKSHIGSKKSSHDKSLDKITSFHHDDAQCNKNSQDYED